VTGGARLRGRCGSRYELIAWQGTRRRDIADYVDVLADRHEAKHGHRPGERASYALAERAAAETRPAKVVRPLPHLRRRWRASAVQRFGDQMVDGLLRPARAAAAKVLVRVRPVVDVALVAVDVIAVVCVMKGAFSRRHLLAEARRHLAQTLRGLRHEAGLDDVIVQAAIDGYTRPIGRGRAVTADLRSLYPRDLEDQAVVRPLTRARSTSSRCQRARLAAGALTARLHAVRRSRRLNSRPLPPAVAPAGPPPRPLRHRRARGAGAVRDVDHALELTTDVATLEDSRRLIEATAKLQNGIRQRSAATDFAADAATTPRPRPAAAPSHTQQPGAHRPPGRSTPTRGTT
jgi:hypothetical protein